MGNRSRAPQTTPSAARQPFRPATPNGSDAFNPADEWNGFATDTFDGLGAHESNPGDQPPQAVSTSPGSGEANVPVGANSSVTFSEPVDVTGASEGIFVFTTSARTAVVGDAVQVSGRVQEFRPGGATHSIAVQVTDEGGLSAVSTATVSVTNVEPTVAASFSSGGVTCGANNATL